jgi:hypothetical protein
MQELSSTYLNSLGNKFIKEITPLGDVILSYNNAFNTYDYYCKKSNTISFNYLEVVSRMYVVNFDCKSIYNDNYDNLVLLYNKKYGIKNDDASIKLTTKTSEVNEVSEVSENVFFTKKSTSSKNTHSLNFVSNKYKYKGTIDDFINSCKVNNLTICFNTNNTCIQDTSSCFFYLEKKNTDLEDSRHILSFKNFKNITL